MFPAMVIVPTLQIAWTLFSILSGMLYFQEYKDFSKLGAAMFVVGLFVSDLGDCWYPRKDGTITEMLEIFGIACLGYGMMGALATLVLPVVVVVENAM